MLFTIVCRFWLGFIQDKITITFFRGGGHEREPAVMPRYFSFRPRHAHIIISQ
jgi:hypothetical protein